MVTNGSQKKPAATSITRSWSYGFYFIEYL